MRKVLLAALPVFLCAFTAFGQEGKTVNKNVTMIQAQTTADGKTEVREQLLEECIVALPALSALEPAITTDAKYLKEINGDPAKNDFIQTYAAALDINYLVHRKVLLIITTNSVPAQPPVTREMQKTLRESQHFESDPANGDLFAGHSKRQYFFSTADGAANDVKKKAEAWLKQQASVVCPAGK
jgi:hypothetical protein